MLICKVGDGVSWQRSNAKIIPCKHGGERADSFYRQKYSSKQKSRKDNHGYGNFIDDTITEMHKAHTDMYKHTVKEKFKGSHSVTNSRWPLTLM